MRKPWLRENKQPSQDPTARQLAAEIWTQISPSKCLHSLILQSLLSLKMAHRFNQFSFQCLLWKLCAEVCIVEQVEVGHEKWRGLFGIFEKVWCCILCYKARFILFMCICYQPSKYRAPNMCSTANLCCFPTLTFKSCPNIFITACSITHSNLQSSVFLMCIIHLWYQKLSFSLFFLEKFLHLLIFQLKKITLSHLTIFFK